MTKNYKIYAGSVGTPQGNAGSLSGHGEGVYTLSFDGKTLQKDTVASCVYAGIITTSKDGKYLYAANEAKDFGGRNGTGGGLSAFHIEEDGTLTKLNDSISYGSRTSYITLSTDEKHILVTNHGSHSTIACSYQYIDGQWKFTPKFDDSSIAVFQRNEDGSIGTLTDLKVFDGSGYWCHGGGQSTSHLHCIRERNGLVFAMNRGADEIEVCKLDTNGKLTVLNTYKTRYGYAPRHMDFHPTLPMIYVVMENYPAVCVYSYTDMGELKEEQFLPTMPQAYYDHHPLPTFTKPHAEKDEYNTSGMHDLTQIMPSDIHIKTNGKNLYVSNRQRNGIGSISCYSVNDSGLLTYAQTLNLDSKDPRGFQIIDDTYLIVGYCEKDEVVVYKLEENGEIGEETDKTIVMSPSSFRVVG